MSRHLTTTLCVLLLGACGGSEAAPPTNEETGTGTPTTDTVTDTVDPSTTGDTDPTDPTDATVDPDSTGDDPTTGGEECLGRDGCWDCEPTQSEHLLNRCTDGECEPFPITTERLPLLEADGSLPPIP